MRTRLFTILLLSTLSLIVVAQNKSVAILNPLDRDETVSSMYKIIVRSSFETVASITQGYEAFDRTALDAIMSEHNFQRSGAVNDSEVRQIGKMAGVDYVLVTEVSAENNYLVVQAKILNVETAKYDRAVDDLMGMTPPIVKEGCTKLAQRLFKINLQTGNQRGTITYNGNKYVGEYRGEKPNGKGKMYYVDDNLSTYEGEFVNGNRQGYGVLIWARGDRYEGHWMNDKRDGEGKMYYFNGEKWDGEWVNDVILNGTIIFASGDKYVGHFQNSQLHGQGTYYWTNGKKYEGEWVNGSRTGQGTMYLTNGDKYVAGWKNGKLNGKYTTYYANGDKYVGECEDGKQKGEGTYYWANGDKSVYEYENGELKKSTKYYVNGDKLVSESENGELKKITNYYVNGDKYVIEYENGKQKGEGTYYWANGLKKKM